MELQKHGFEPSWRDDLLRNVKNIVELGLIVARKTGLVFRILLIGRRGFQIDQHRHLQSPPWHGRDRQAQFNVLLQVQTHFDTSSFPTVFSMKRKCTKASQSRARAYGLHGTAPVEKERN